VQLGAETYTGSTQVQRVPESPVQCQEMGWGKCAQFAQQTLSVQYDDLVCFTRP